MTALPPIAVPAVAPSGEGRDKPFPLSVARAAAVWLECGVRRSEPVAIRLEPGIESLAACLGVASVGGVPVPVDPSLSPHALERLWSQSRWRFILAESRAEQPAALRDAILTLDEWRLALAQSAPVDMQWSDST